MSQLQHPQPPDSVTPTEGTAKPLSLSVVIPFYQKIAPLILCLKSLGQTGWQMGSAGRLEIIVQDDASPDVDAVRVIGPPAKVARSPANLGFAGNCNAGAARAGGDVLLFLNQDTVARPGWFEPIAALFADPRVGVVGPKLVVVDDKGEESIQSCGGLYGVNKGPYHRFLGYAPDDWRVNVRERVSWTTGAALAIRRELFVKVGGFDVGYERGYFEDVDLCEKAKAAGYEVWYEPEAVFEHSVGSTGGVPAHIFKANSMRFHRLWDERIVPDSPVAHVNY